MAIRLRRVDGMLVALCAAKSIEKPGDIYLDGNTQHALNEKCAEDFQLEGYNTRPLDLVMAKHRAQEESNNPARDWWDLTYANRLDAEEGGS